MITSRVMNIVRMISKILQINSDDDNDSNDNTIFTIRMRGIMIKETIINNNNDSKNDINSSIQNINVHDNIPCNDDNYHTNQYYTFTTISLTIIIIIRWIRIITNKDK